MESGPIFLTFIIAWAIFMLPPVMRILRRLGYSRWWALITLFPLFQLIGLWVLAFIEWPSQTVASKRRS
jgi:predicted PurR-regulated permease PerM